MNFDFFNRHIILHRGHNHDILSSLSLSLPSVVLSELVSSEFTYVQSLETLIETYVPMFSDKHIPTYLQGRRDAIFANLEQVYVFQR